MDGGGRRDAVVSVRPEKQAIVEEAAESWRDPLRARDAAPLHHRAGTLSEIRGKIEKHIKNTFLKAMQAPIGVKPVLKAWMELN